MAAPRLAIIRLDEIPRSDVNKDIRAYLMHEINIIRDYYKFEPEWLGVKTLIAMVERAAGTFKWAATACRFM